jgi:hypothetical protein
MERFLNRLQTPHTRHDPDLPTEQYSIRFRFSQNNSQEFREWRLAVPSNRICSVHSPSTDGRSEERPSDDGLSSPATIGRVNPGATCLGGAKPKTRCEPPVAKRRRLVAAGPPFARTGGVFEKQVTESYNTCALMHQNHHGKRDNVRFGGVDATADRTSALADGRLIEGRERSVRAA